MGNSHTDTLMTFKRQIMRFSSSPIGNTDCGGRLAGLVRLSSNEQARSDPPFFGKQRRQQPDRLAGDRGARAGVPPECALLYA